MEKGDDMPDNLPQPLKCLAMNWEDSRKVAERLSKEHTYMKKLLWDWVDGKYPDDETKEFLLGYWKAGKSDLICPSQHMTKVAPHVRVRSVAARADD